MTRFGKRKNSSKFGSSKNLLKRNPPADVLNKSKDALKSRAEHVKKHTTKELPYMGSAESAAIADLLNEPGNVKPEILAKKISDSDECLNNLAFNDAVKAYFDILSSTLESGGNNVLSKTSLDERVPLMVSVGISKILSEILDDLKKTSKTTIQQDTGKTIHFINVEDLFERVDDRFSKVINLKSQRVTDQTNEIAIYQIISEMDANTIEDALKTPHTSRIINGLLTVKEKHVGKTFKFEPSDPQVQAFSGGALKTSVENFLTGCGRITFVSNISATNKNNAKNVVAAIFGCIATHIISYTFIATVDGLIRSIMDAGETDIAKKLDNVLIHRAMIYPSLITAIDLYDMSESKFDNAMAHEIRTVAAVKDVFKAAIESYDYDASAIAAKTYRHEAPKVPSFLKSPEEILQAQMKLDKMLITKAKNAPGRATYNAPGSNVNGVNHPTIETQLANSRINKLEADWSFGRRRRSSKRRNSFGKKRRSSKRRASFGRRRRSSKRRVARASFGKKRRSSKRRLSKFGNDLENIISFGRKRRSSKRRVAEFGRKRRSSKRRASLFGRRRRSSHKRRNSFGKKRRSSKRRVAEFGRRRRSSHKRRALRSSFGKKRRSHKRRASLFGRKRRSHRRRI